MKKRNSEFSYLIKKWKKKFVKSDYKIQKIRIYKILSRKNINFLSALIDIKFKNKLNRSIDRFCLIVPESVVIVPILILKNKKYTMMIEQQRIDEGQKALEFAAGAIHTNETIILAAQKEIYEELDLKIDKKEIKMLKKFGVRMDPSMTTSKAYFFYFIKKIDKDFLKSYENRFSGLGRLGEYLKIKNIDLKKLKNINTSSAIIGLKFIEDKFGKIR